MIRESSTGGSQGLTAQSCNSSGRYLPSWEGTFPNTGIGTSSRFPYRIIKYLGTGDLADESTDEPRGGGGGGARDDDAPEAPEGGTPLAP
jgi:hypothetical protein